MQWCGIPLVVEQVARCSISRMAIGVAARTNSSTKLFTAHTLQYTRSHAQVGATKAIVNKDWVSEYVQFLWSSFEEKGRRTVPQPLQGCSWPGQAILQSPHSSPFLLLPECNSFDAFVHNQCRSNLCLLRGGGFSK